MVDAKKKEDKDKKDDGGDKKDDKDAKEEEKVVVPLPPLEAASRRLERLLGGGLSDADGKVYTYSNPVKVVRRWLGTASGASGKATTEDIVKAAAVLLDPSSDSAKGREILVALAPDVVASLERAKADAGAAAAAEDAMEVEADGDESDKANEKTTGTGKKGEAEELGFLSVASSREVESWLLSLQVRILWKDGKNEEAFQLSQQSISILLGHLNVASQKVTSSSGISTISSLFPLLARLYRFRSLAAKAMKDPAITTSLRKEMAQAHNMACLRRDVDSQATLLNLMVEDLLDHSQVEQANKLLSNSTFPESASNNQLCRHLYYSGRIHALRLEYTKAFSSLSQCLRKAPSNTGLGFRITAQRLLVIVQLLMGEIPERHVFTSKGMTTELAPYLAITQAVRRGDLAVFKTVVTEYASRLQLDGTYTLISRLAHQVVKAGLRKLHVSYSRLSLQDVADRLGLPSATSAEFVVAKAVRDGVLDATIYHEEGYVQSHDLVDVYATKEPAEAFHRRIAYCLTTHNDAVRGMRYPPDQYKQQLEASRGNRRRKSDDKTDEEKAQELEDELDEDY